MKGQILALAFVLGGALSASAFSYGEAADGDIASYDEGAPTPLGAIDEGVNLVEGTATAEIDWGDVFSVDVPPGLEITDVTVQISAHTGGFDAVTKVFETPVFQGLEHHLFAIGGTHSFSVVPLSAPGPYGFTAQFIGADTGDSYGWRWTIVAPEPSAGTGSLAGAAALAGTALARARSGPRAARRGRA
jgi:hypothetical protein